MTNRTRGLRGRILSAVAPANALFIAISCGGSSDGGGPLGPTAGSTGTAGTAGTAGAPQPGSGGSGGGGAETGGTGGSVAGGGSATGGSSGSPSAGGTANYGCSNPGPGTCCNTDTCYTRAQIRALLQTGAGGDASEGGAGSGEGGAAGQGEEACPTAVGHQLQVCSFITADLPLAGDECCYVVRSGSCCGRPFVVDGPRVAALAARADWRAARIDLTDEVPASWRSALARAWGDDALMEHASIASFARFSLELLAIGAPSSLVEAAHRAALDEVAHARDCFALASRFSARELGPGDLAMSGLEIGRDLEELAVAAFHEGCIGETLAAALAAEQAAVAGDETCRRVLGRIASDEEEHSLLAWRFLRYALERGGSAIAERLRIELSEVSTQLASSSTPVPPEVWNHYGRLTAEQQTAVVARTWSEVIRPAFALLGGQPVPMHHAALAC